MDELAGVPNGKNCASNQVLYHLGSRGIEWAAAAPMPEGQDHGDGLFAAGAGAAAAQAGAEEDRRQAWLPTPPRWRLAWVLRQPGVITIPKAVKPEHVRANLKALEVKLDTEDLKALDAAFPPPKRAAPLDMT